MQICKLLSGNETERCCADLNRNKPNPDSGRKPANKRLRLGAVSTWSIKHKQFALYYNL